MTTPRKKKPHGGARKGAGRPPTVDGTRFVARTMTLTASTWTALEAMAQANGLPCTAAVRLVIDEGLKHPIMIPDLGK